MEIPKKEYKIKQSQIVRLSDYYNKVVGQNKPNNNTNNTSNNVPTSK